MEQKDEEYCSEELIEFSGTYHSGYKIKGLKEGEWIGKYKNGQIHYQFNYLNGKLHGDQKEWYKNGQLECHHFYNNGKRHGEQKGWDTKGNLACYEIYENGNLVNEEVYKNEVVSMTERSAEHLKQQTIEGAKKRAYNIYDNTVLPRAKDGETYILIHEIPSAVCQQLELLGITTKFVIIDTTSRCELTWKV